MKIKHLPVILLTVLTVSNSSLFSQTKGGLFKKFFSQDSLAGFDENAAKVIAIEEGAFGDVFNLVMSVQKRNYINTKYNIGQHYEVPVDVNDPNYNPAPNSKSLGGNNNVILNAPCVNEGFELNNLSGWAAFSGSNSSANGSCFYTVTPNVMPFPSQQCKIRTTPFNDFALGNVSNSPFPGSKVIKLNDSIAIYGMTRIIQTFPVTTANYLYEFAYRAAMTTPNHPCCDQSYMRVAIRNQGGALLPCPTFTFAPPGTGNCYNPGIVWTTTNTALGLVYINPAWQRYSIDLQALGLLGQPVSVEVTLADCSASGHWGYAYFDSNCGEVGFTVNGTFYPAPTNTVYIPAVCGQAATLSAQSGLGPYQWTGPGITGTLTTQTFTTSLSGNYLISMNPPGSCNPITRVVNLTFPPPTTVTANPATVCPTGNTSSTLTATGAAQYTWQTTPTQTTPIIVVSPTVTTIYSVTVRTGTCIGTRTVLVTAAPNPTVAISNSDPVICGGGSSTLTGSGANSYFWNPGGMTTTVVVVSPGITTDYTLTGTTSSGCVDTETTRVSVTTATVPLAFNLTGSICAGSSAQLIGAGYPTFTWIPTSPLQTGFNPIVSPTVTTTFTAIGGVGSCSNTATVTVIVDQGPTMTVTSSPTLICPGNNATLSASSPTAIGSFTWMPGNIHASSIVVTPTITSNYSVTGVNANGCRRTYTIDQNVAPVPTISIAPPTKTVCIGSSITMTASGGISYTWTPGPAFTATRQVSPIVNTTYTVTASNGTCTSSMPTTVVVVPLPTVVAVASPTAICLGLNSTLSATGAVTYVWLPGGSTGSSIVVSPPATTMYTVTGNTGGCTSSRTVNLIVNSLPAITASASSASVCPGNCSTLTANGGLTYTWMPGGLVTNTISVCPTVATTYTATGVNAFGCVNTATVRVGIFAVPNVSIAASSATICRGSSATFTASGAVNYTWSTGQLVPVIIVSPTITTSYTVTGVNVSGCVGQRTISLIVVPSPTVTASASPTAICSGACAVLSASGATTYTWMPGNIVGPNASVCPTITTTYSVTGNSAGCLNTRTLTLVVNNGPTLTIAATPTAVCPGACSTLSVTGGLSYTWTPGGVGSSISACPLTTTTYSVRGVNASGCVTTRTLSLVVNPVPSITITASAGSICQGSSVTFTARGAQSYVWSTGATTSVISVSPSVSTIYTVTGTSSLGCVGQRTVSIIVVPTPSPSASKNPTAACAGGNTTLTASGATSYTWSTGSQATIIVVAPPVTTTYTLFATQGGCVGSTVVTVIINSAPSVSVSASPTAVCAGNCSTLTATGALGYTWNPGNLTGSAVSVCPPASQIYTVVGSNGCTTTRTINLVVNPLPILTATASPASICAGQSTSLSANGANSYTWTPGNLIAQGVLVSPGASTTYTVRGTSASGCIGQLTLAVTVNTSPAVSAISTPTAVCAGSSALLLAIGANGNYTWQPGNLLGANVTVTPAITTTYVVTGANITGCTGTAAVVLVVNPIPSLTVTATPTAICGGGNSTLTVAGASTYTWNPGGSNATLIVVSPPVTTNYTVIGRSAAGCTASAIRSLPVSTVPIITAAAAPATICAGAAALLTANGGISYTWTPGNLIGSIVTVTPPASTVYTVTGVNAAGCSNQTIVSVVVLTVPTIIVSTAQPTICAGNCATMTATGANTYTWLPGPLSGSNVAVCPTVTTNYTVVGNTGGCNSPPVTRLITVNSAPNFTISANPAGICPGRTATLTAIGAVAYTWNPGNLFGATVTVSPPATTIYTATGMGANGCTATRTLSLPVFTVPVITAVANPTAICFGMQSLLVANGGISYTWMPGNIVTNPATVSPTVSTIYTVTGINGSGCTGQNTVSVIVLPNPTITASSSASAVCIGNCSTLTALGATSYTWLPVLTTGSVLVVCPPSTSAYSVVGSNGACNSNIVALTIVVNNTPNVVASATPVAICPGGTASLVATGASTYTWNPGNLSGPTVTVSPSAFTQYTVVGSSTAGCQTTRTVNLIVNPSVTINIATSAPGFVCAGTSITFTASGNSSTYTWSPGGMPGAIVTVTPPVTTTYTVSGTNINGCVGQKTITAFISPSPTINATASPTAICPGGIALITVSGASNPYTLTPGGAGLSPFPVSPGVTTTYTVSGTALGCTGSKTVTVVVNPVPSFTATAIQPSICPGSSSTLSAVGALSYTWQPINLIGNAVIVTPPSTTIYTATGINNFGCTSTRTVMVTVFPVTSVSASASPSIVCAGRSSTLIANGASTYTWLPGPLFGSSVAVNPTSTTNYTVTGTSVQGCNGQAFVSVTVIPNPTITASANPNPICPGAISTLTASGASTYSWSTGSTTSVSLVSPVFTSTYSVYGIALNGCSSGNTIVLTVTVNPAPSLSVAASPPFICQGFTSNLSVGGANSYTWQPGNMNGNLVTVSPTATTIYTVTGTNAFGCTGTNTVSLVVFPNPTISTSATSTNICLGQQTTLTAIGATSFTWMPGPLGGSLVVVSPTVSTNYTVNGTLGNCTSTATRSITVSPIPIVGASAVPFTICPGGSSTLTANGALNYTWSPGPIVGNPVTVSPPVTTIYTVIGASAAGCTGTQTVAVNVLAPVAGTASINPSSVCSGGCATLTLAGSSGSVQWQQSLISGIGPFLTIGGATTTPYVYCPITTPRWFRALVTTVCGNMLSNVVQVTLNPSPFPFVIPNPASICIGGSVTLNAGGANTYSWAPPAGLSCVNCANPIASPTVTTIYSLTGISVSGCTTMITVTVNVNPLPVITASASPAGICPGGSSTLTANGGITYSWIPGNFTGGSVVVSPSVTTTYTVTGTNINGCINSQTVTVTVNPPPALAITNANSNPICSGSSAALTATGGVTYTWMPGGTMGSTVSVTPSVTTIYTVTGTNIFGCTNTAVYILTVNPTPTVTASASSPTVCSGFTVALAATGANSYTWSPGGLPGGTVIVTPTASTIYTVSGLTNGCFSAPFTTVSIVVVPLPNVSASANPAIICSGDSSTLTATGALSYTWMPGVLTGSSIVVTPPSTTIYTVAGMAASGCPNFTLVAVNVIPTPTVTAASSSTAICIGSSATLTANGATNYTWNPTGITGSIAVVNPTAATIYTITGASGACVGTTTISLFVNPLPVISASISNAVICMGETITLSASGALNYTWNPMGSTGQTVTDSPTISITYTTIGEDANGCTNTASVSVLVNPLPVLVPSASPTAICAGSTVTLSANGAVSFTWNPGPLNGSPVTDTPSVTTDYTVTGTDANGCVGSNTVSVIVIPNPTLIVAPLNSSICIGSTASLTVTGASNYTWEPGTVTTSVVVVSPTASTIYTVTGENGGICFDTFTVNLFVNPLPANVTATCSGTITCGSPSVSLTGSSTDTNVIYYWTGPQSYTSAVQNPTGVTVWGVFTLVVTDTVTGCMATTTVNVPTDGSIPLVTATSSGSITCAVATVTLNAVNTTTNPGYSWTGPSGFTSTAQIVTITLPGDYSVTVTDLTSNCTATAVVSVGIHTRVAITATISPATCSLGVSNNDGTIMVANFGSLDKFDLVVGASYTGAVTYTNAALIPTTGIITSNLSNPTTTLAYTMRLFDSEGCIKDTTLILIPIDCVPKSLGLAKEVSIPTFNEDGTYNVTYSVVVKNYGTTAMSNVFLNENLSTTFPLPTTFTLTAAPSTNTLTSGLALNSGFNGVSQINLVNPLTSTIAGNRADTITFTVKVTPNGFFGPFKNRVIGLALTSSSVVVKDTSNTGMNPDPNNDGVPNNNNLPTVVTFTPDLFFGITKTGEYHKTDNNTYDVSYTVTIHNLGNDTLVNVTVKDSLFANTVKGSATYNMVSAPVVDGGLSPNAAFDGKFDINLLATNSKLPPGTVSSIRFVISVNTGTVLTSTVLKNSAYGNAFNTISDKIVSDTSNTGVNPDSNNNNVWNEPEDNVPTILILPPAVVTPSLFVPEGFSPNNDGINDVFVIKGLPDDRENSLTIFNRWGNKVYFQENYANMWDGHPNSPGTMGHDKLPQGTYYFILDMKGLRVVTGFIVLQY